MSDWRPTISLSNLKQRAVILANIRQFFAERDVLEVETPSLSHATVTDPYIHSITADCYVAEGSPAKTMYLQTSPEYAMKRLLAAGSGSIYQICKAFRNEEMGRLHNLEFTILEWYRIGFTHHDLMDEMDELLQLVLNTKPAKRLSYAEVFANYVGINPHLATAQQLKQRAIELDIKQIAHVDADDKDVWLQLLMSEFIESRLKDVVFIYDYPVTQAALAQIRDDDPSVAERFEVYIDGIELANGFHELNDAKEQRVRFMKDIRRGTARRAPTNYQIDELFLQALEHGLPECSGVALGIDRLVMLALGEEHISQVVSFWDNA